MSNIVLTLKAFALIVTVMAFVRIFTHKKEIGVLSMLWNLVAVLLWIAHALRD